MPQVTWWGYIIIKDSKVTVCTWEVKDLHPVLSKKRGSTLVNV